MLDVLLSPRQVVYLGFSKFSKHPVNDSWPYRVKEAVPERPQAGVSSESWTSWRCPSLLAWRLRPRQRGYTVESPWTERSGHSGCSTTGQLQKDKRVRCWKVHMSTWKPGNRLGFSAAFSHVKKFQSVLLIVFDLSNKRDCLIWKNLLHPWLLFCSSEWSLL